MSCEIFKYMGTEDYTAWGLLLILGTIKLFEISRISGTKLAKWIDKRIVRRIK